MAKNLCTIRVITDITQATSRIIDLLWSEKIGMAMDNLYVLQCYAIKTAGHFYTGPSKESSELCVLNI